jgi:hypothetical protein
MSYGRRPIGGTTGTHTPKVLPRSSERGVISALATDGQYWLARDLLNDGMVMILGAKVGSGAAAEVVVPKSAR